MTAMHHNDEDRPAKPGLDGQPEPGSPAWDIDAYSPTGRPYGYQHLMPRSPENGKKWLAGQVTLGNIVTVAALLIAAGAWISSAERAPEQLAQQIAQHRVDVSKETDRLQRDVQGLQQQSVSKEMLDAKMGTILERLKAIDDRLARIERNR